MPEETAVETPRPRITRKGLARLQEKHLLANIDPLLQELYPALTKKVKDGNMKAIELVMQMSNLVKTPGGVNITQTILQQNSNTAGPSNFNFEALARRLDKRDSDAAKGIIDVTPEDEE
jgi:hypothetical protein